MSLRQMPGAQVGRLMGEVTIAIKDCAEMAGRGDPDAETRRDEIMATIKQGIEAGAPYRDMLQAVDAGCNYASRILDEIRTGTRSAEGYSEDKHLEIIVFISTWMAGVEEKALAYQAGMRPPTGCAVLIALVAPVAIVLAIATTPFIACGNQEPSPFDPKSGSGIDYIGLAPDGTVTPSFKSNTDLKAYIRTTPFSPPSGPAPRLAQGPTPKANS